MNITLEELMMPAEKFKTRVRELRQEEDAEREAIRRIPPRATTPCPACWAVDPKSGAAHGCRHCARKVREIEFSAWADHREAQAAGVDDEGDEGGEE